MQKSALDWDHRVQRVEREQGWGGPKVQGRLTRQVPVSAYFKQFLTPFPRWLLHGRVAKKVCALLPPPAPPLQFPLAMVPSH